MRTAGRQDAPPLRPHSASVILRSGFRRYLIVSGPSVSLLSAPLASVKPTVLVIVPVIVYSPAVRLAGMTARPRRKPLLRARTFTRTGTSTDPVGVVWPSGVNVTFTVAVPRALVLPLLRTSNAIRAGRPRTRLGLPVRSVAVKFTNGGPMAMAPDEATLLFASLSSGTTLVASTTPIRR